MVELAIATGIAVADWESCDDSTLATAVHVLEERARRGR